MDNRGYYKDNSKVSEYSNYIQETSRVKKSVNLTNEIKSNVIDVNKANLNNNKWGG